MTIVPALFVLAVAAVSPGVRALPVRSLAVGIQTGQQAEQEQTHDIGAALWSMRRSAQERDWRECVRWAGIVLAMPHGSIALIRAEVLLYRFAAERALASDAAPHTLAEFESIIADEGDLDWLALQMRLLRNSLGDELPRENQPDTFEPAPDGLWTTATPEDHGLDARPLAAHLEHCKKSGADAVLVARGGAIVQEWYSPLYHEPVYTMSSVKSITGLLAGVLVDAGKLDVSQRVGAFVPEWNEGDRASVTVEHLLTMSSGLPRVRGGVGMNAGGDATAYCAGLDIQYEPGERFVYSNEGVQLLSPVLETAAGVPLWEFARDELFAPMGLTTTEMRRDSVGNTLTYADARTTLRELARFGQLVLDDGMVGDRSVISSEWLDAMAKPSEASAGYGYLWWLYEDPKVVAMQGYLHTSVWVFPELDIVVARVQSRPYLHAVEAYEPGKMFAWIGAAAGESR